MQENAPQVNVAVQLVPINTTDSYAIVDKAIELIKESGLKYEVGPFSTSLEGSMEELMDLIYKIREVGFEAGADELLINLQIHTKRGQDVRASDKTDKYR